MRKTNIAIWGFGITGKASLNYFLKSKKFSDIELLIDIYDGSSANKFAKNLIDGAPENVRFFFGSDDIRDIAQYDFVMASPSISNSHPDIVKAHKMGIPIYNDVSFFIEQWLKTGKRSIGVTGSNGKSTVVTLVHGALQSAGIKSILVGNIGKSPLDYLLRYEEGNLEIDVPVLELSSYQLEKFTTNQFVDIAVISNISPNHLDHHNNSIEEYSEAKLKILGPNSKLVTVVDDSGIQKHILPKVAKTKTQVIQVSLDNPSHQLKYFVREDSRSLKGQHNLYNIAISLEVLKILEINSRPAHDFLQTYSGLEHRIEFVSEISSVKYINDSKSTSPASIKVALEAFGNFKNVVLIAGGNDKKVSFDILNESFNQYVKFLIIFDHEINDKLKKIALRHDIPHVVTANLIDCVKIARREAAAGDYVLFSPGAASFGRFKCFEDRGQKFKDCVKNLRK